MQYLYNENAGEDQIKIEGEDHKYLFRVRRFEKGKVISLRNLKDHNLYRYKIDSIAKKDALLILESTQVDEQIDEKYVHILWCIIDPKILYQTLPMLNQIGVSKISFIYCARSQKNFKVDLDKARKILINSSQQCGRVKLMQLEILSDLNEAIELYKDFAVMDFGGDLEWGDLNSALIGCEGGFSDDERNRLNKHRKIGIKSANILKSETATLIFSTKTLI